MKGDYKNLKKTNFGVDIDQLSLVKNYKWLRKFSTYENSVILQIILKYNHNVIMFVRSNENDKTV